MSDDLSLADIPAGPELGELLDYVGQHRDELRGAELVEFIAATQRLINWATSLQVSAVNELAYCPPTILEQDTMRTESRSELAAGAIEAALGWSRGWARRFDDVSYLLVELFPATLQTLCDGLIDLPTARAIADGLAVLDDPQVREEIEADLLARLAELRDKGRRSRLGLWRGGWRLLSFGPIRLRRRSATRNGSTNAMCCCIRRWTVSPTWRSTTCPPTRHCGSTTGSTPPPKP